MFSADDYTDGRWHQRLAPIAHELFTELLTEVLLSYCCLGTVQELYSVMLKVI